MDNAQSKRFVLIISVLITILVTVVSVVGFFTSGFYSAETPNWQAQSIGQDMIDLFLIVPCLFFSGLFAFRGNKVANSIWGGVVFYLTYTFALYSFDVHFNKLFIMYCITFGLSFYASLYFLFFQYKKREDFKFRINFLFCFIGVYFIVIAVLFYLLWLKEIIPAIVQNVVPESIREAGLLTNGVHVIDLAIFLPGIFITGMLLIKGKPIGYILTPVILTFFILMNITIGALVLVMRSRGLEGSVILPFIMGVLASLSLLLLILFFRRTRNSL